MSFRNTGRAWGPAHFPWLTVAVASALVVVFALERPWQRTTRAAERAGARGEATALARRVLVVEVPVDSPVDALAEGQPRHSAGER